MKPQLTRFEKFGKAFRNAALGAVCFFIILEAIAANQWVPLAPLPETGNVYPIGSKGGIVYVQKWLYDVSKIAPWGLRVSIGLLAVGICLYRKDLSVRR